MKKYLMSGALALIAGLFVTSCSDDDVYGNVDVIEQKMQGFQEAFKKAFGTINPNQTWGFSQTNAETRGVTSSKVRTRAVEGGWDISSGFDMTFDRQYYIDVFNYLPEGVNAGSQLTNYEFVSSGPFEFSIIYSQTSGQDKVGYYYYDPINGVNSRTEVVFVDNIQNLGNYVEVFREESWGTWWEGMGLWSGPTPWIQGTQTSARAKVFTVNIPTGYRVGFFLQQNDFKAYSNSDLNNETNGQKNYYSAVVAKDGSTYLVGLEDWDNQWGGSDLDCNDVIIAINRNTSTPPTLEGEEYEPEITWKETYVCTIEEETMEAGKVFCEDLSAYRSTADIDYNDAVFDATITKRTYIIETWEESFADGVSRNDKYIKNTDSGDILLTNIELYAAGGTLPLTIVGQEVHDLFEVGGTTMVNTRDKNTETVNGANTVVRETVRLINPNASTEDFANIAFDNNKEILEKWNDPRGTGELAEEKYYFTEFKKILDIPVIVQYEDGNVLELKSEPGKAPHKILVDKTYPGTDVAVRWASERCSIKDAYSAFTDYVNGNEYVEGKVPEFWLNGGNDDYLYEATNAISTEAAGTHSVIAKGEDNVTLYVLWQSTDPEGDDISRGLYFTDRSLLINEGIKVGDKIRFEGKKTDDSWALFLSDGNSSGIHSDLTSFNKQNYAEVTLTADMVDKLLNNNTNAAMVISGYGLALTRVSLIKK